MHVLANLGWLSHCAPGFRAFVLANLKEQTFPPGVAMTHAGDSEGGIFGLIEGQASFVTTIGSPAIGMAHIGLPGSWWGQAPLLGMPRLGFATTRTACRVGIVPLGALRVHLGQTPEHWQDIANCFTDLFMLAAGAHADSIIPDHRRRMAATLLRMGGLRHRRFDVQVPGSFLCTQEDLAGAMGMARNTVGRLLRGLEAAGLVSARYGRMTLDDIPRLQALANTE